MSAITSTGCGRKLPDPPAPLAPGAFTDELTLADDRDAAMQSLVSCGWTHRRIGRLFGLHGTSVARILERLLTLPCRDPDPEPLTALEVDQLLREYASDFNLSQTEWEEATEWIERQNPADIGPWPWGNGRSENAQHRSAACDAELPAPNV